MIQTSRTLLLSSLIGSSLVLSSAQVAFAAGGHDRMTFNSFRDLNPGLNRSAAREIFRAERRMENRAVHPAQVFTNNNQNPGQIRFNAEAPKHFLQLERLNVDHIRRNSFQATDLGRNIRLNNGINLDLTSDVKNITLGQGLFAGSSSIEITVGGESRTVSAGEKVTAAEYVAVKQALSGGGQKVIVDSNGAAIGGQVDLGQLTANNDVMRASNLVVSANVTTSGDFGKGSDFRLLGDLSNFGTVQAFSTDHNVRAGAIRAENIANHSSGLITSDVDLTLDAAGRISNEGTIVSSQGLTLAAGNEVNNIGSISAAGNVNLNAASVNNAGNIQSTAGNINLNGSDTAALVVNNYGGTLNARAGAINLRNTAYSGTYASTIVGGDLFSRELNLHAGQGVADVYVDDLTGVVQETGTAAHVVSDTDTLNIGNVCLTGDPTFYNTGGNINITASVLAPEALTLVATGDITSSAGAITVQAGNDNQGFDITFIAGAAFTTSGGASTPTFPGGTAGGVSLSGKASTTGGSILLGDGTLIVARSTQVVPGGDDPGGDILFAAFGGKTAGTGRIDIGEAELSTGGRGNGVDGNVKLVGGAKTGAAITTGIINTTGGALAAGQGDIDIYNKKPGTSIKRAPVVYNEFGARTSPAEIMQTGKTIKTANTEVRNPNAGALGINASGELLFDTGGDLLINGNIVTNGGINLRAPNGNVFMSADTVNVAPVISNDLIELFSTKGTIGTDASPIRIDSANFSADNPRGNLINVTNVHAGAVSADFLVTKGKVRVNIPNASFSMVEPIRASEVDATASAGIGTLGTPFIVNNIKKFTANAATIFLQQNGKKSPVYNLTADTEARINSVSSILINGATVTNGIFSATTGAGTITVGGNITTLNGIDLDNNSAKGKIVFNTGITMLTTSAVAGAGDINISVGPSSATPNAGPFANINLVGPVNVTGAGVAGSAPVNTISATTAEVNIDNGAKSAKNIFLDGSVQIRTEP